MSSSMPAVSAFNFATPGCAVIDAGAPYIILGASTVHLQAWVYFNGPQPSANQKVVVIPNSLILGVGFNAQNQLVLYPEVWDSAGNHFWFLSGEVPVNQWVLLELVWVQGQSLTGYINGVQAGSVPVSGQGLQLPPKDNTQVMLGAMGDGTAYPLSGMIQSVVLTNTAGVPSDWVMYIQPGIATSSWGASGISLQGGAVVTALSAPPSTPYSPLALPPAPASINDPLPGQTQPAPAFQMIVPSADPTVFTMLSVQQYWVKLMELTGSPGLGTSKSRAVTTGITTSQSMTETMGVSLGLEAGFDMGLFSSKVNLTLSYSQAFTEEISLTKEVTRTDEFSIPPPAQTTTGVWWQPVTVLSSVQLAQSANSVQITTATVSDQDVDTVVGLSYPPSAAKNLKHATLAEPASKASAVA